MEQLVEATTEINNINNSQPPDFCHPTKQMPGDARSILPQFDQRPWHKKGWTVVFLNSRLSLNHCGYWWLLIEAMVALSWGAGFSESTFLNQLDLWKEDKFRELGQFWCSLAYFLRIFRSNHHRDGVFSCWSHKLSHLKVSLKAFKFSKTRPLLGKTEIDHQQTAHKIHKLLQSSNAPQSTH